MRSNSPNPPGESGLPDLHPPRDPSTNSSDLSAPPSSENGHTTTPDRELEEEGEDGEDEEGGSSSNADIKKPSYKKRKLDDSPPWRSATTQTPTSFLDETGRRKSGRTNPIPLEFLPGLVNKIGDVTRSTRSSRRQSQQPKKDVTFTPAPGASSSRSGTSRARPTSTGKQPGTNGKHHPTTPTPSKSSSRASKSTPTKKPPAPREVSTKKTSSKRGLAQKPITTPKPKPSPVQGTRKSARTASRTIDEPSKSENLSAAKLNGFSEFNFESDVEFEVQPDFKPPKIKLKFGKPKPVITHPLHIPATKEFPTFDDFINQDDISNNPEALAAAEEEAREEAMIRNKIEESVKSGLLTVENCSLNLPEKQPELPQQYAHYDHLVAHALHFQRLLIRERKDHVEIMKKRNAMVMAEIKRKRPLTREEIEQEQWIENRKGYKEQIGQLRRKWEEVLKEVERRRRVRAEEEQRLAGKEHLNQMLEHSTQLLEARRGDRQTSIATQSGGESELGEEDKEEFGEDDEDDDEGEGDNVSENQEMELADEDNMSTSDSEEDDGGDDDENLTVEELKAKYAGVTEKSTSRPTTGGKGLISLFPELSGESPADDEDEALTTDTPGANLEGPDNDDPSDEEMQDISAGHTLEKNRDESSVTLPELEEVDQILMDGSDESTTMDSEEEFDEEDDDDETDDDDSDEEFGTGFGGLMGLYGDLVAKPQGESEDVMMEDEITEDIVTQPSISQGLSSSNAHPEVKATFIEKVPMDDAMIDDNEIEEITREDLSNGHLDTMDAETATSISQADPKEIARPSSLTSPEASPQPNLDIRTPIPFLLRGTLREYQHYGLDWLAGLYSNKTNGILADEMGLGKTIQTIALLAHLACEKEVWGPHLIVVPTSVMLNWEMEFKKWAPGFKILTYYGSREQRLEKRKGWYDDNLWHVCITSYQLVLQDQVTFKRRNWHYLILDEAHNIKNFRSQRWQTLLNFKAEARLLITGTPLQNNLIELWSLLYFLMPSGASSAMPAGFANLKEFQEWFAHPVDQLIEGGREGMDDEAKRTVTKLHRVLRPYLLRRLKADVEKQMPAKYEHIVYCRLSKRQRFLYEEFMSMAQTRETLVSGNYLSIINCLMQLRKVCNHPDLFETRQIVTSFAMKRSVVADYETKELLFCGLVPARNNGLTTQNTSRIQALSATNLLEKYYADKATLITPVEQDLSTVKGNNAYMEYQKEMSHLERLKSCLRLNRIRTQYRPLYARNLVEACSEDISIGPIRRQPKRREQTTEWFLNHSETVRSMIPTIEERTESLSTIIDKFGCVTPHVVSVDMAPIALTPKGVEVVLRAQAEDLFPSDPFHNSRIRQSIAFPDKRLLQYDCGKLQRLDGLLRELQAGGHRALIFTQMTKVLDILEQFLNIHGHRYLRLDGATKVEQRQILTDRFNNDPRILVFILSTRSGGLGINLTGADTVIFYDLDWNPAMDKQCQDRCHRIGQTRDVHIYRFVSEYTIESNILRKSNQKRMLDDVVIQEGDFTTDYFNKLSIRDMLGDDVIKELNDETADAPVAAAGVNMEKALEAAEDVEDAAAAKVAQREVVDADGADFAERQTPSQTPKDTNSPATTVMVPKIKERTKENAGEKDILAEEPPTDELSVPAMTPVESEVVVGEDLNKGLGHDIYGEDWGRVDREPEEVDEYMIRYLEWELIDVPVVLPDKSKKKKNKKGKKF
ncbi:uncharacterized protein H6S33_003649 [Morchella sextelata]|uniref:uncharacterized protein n=1 Tax=Morchella sextelata TaxID=1174677 RepID=UPI001D03F2A9|nr:uncharacterized protein H6S33_003649 [Morchella sextelata]KAH0606815.1 hypothetical protein H6S33_003649 [Morchella sextelata]